MRQIIQMLNKYEQIKHRTLPPCSLINNKHLVLKQLTWFAYKNLPRHFHQIRRTSKPNRDLLTRSFLEPAACIWLVHLIVYVCFRRTERKRDVHLWQLSRINHATNCSFMKHFWLKCFPFQLMNLQKNCNSAVRLLCEQSLFGSS